MRKGFERQYPKGRISGDDDGALEFGIATDRKNDRVIVNFFKPVEWIGLDFESGLQLLTNLSKHLSKLSGTVIEIKVLSDANK